MRDGLINSSSDTFYIVDRSREDWRHLRVQVNRDFSFKAKIWYLDWSGKGTSCGNLRTSLVPEARRKVRKVRGEESPQPAPEYRDRLKRSWGAQRVLNQKIWGGGGPS